MGPRNWPSGAGGTSVPAGCVWVGQSSPARSSSWPSVGAGPEEAPGAQGGGGTVPSSYSDTSRLPQALQSRTGEGLRVPSRGGSLVHVCLQSIPRSVPQLVFVLRVHRGHENLPRKANTHVSQRDVPRSWEWQPVTVCPSLPGHLPMPGAPDPPGSATDGETKARWGKDMSRSFRGLGTGAETRASRVSTPARKHAHTGPFVRPRPLLHGHIQTGGPTPQLPSLGHTHPLSSHTLWTMRPMPQTHLCNVC